MSIKLLAFTVRINICFSSLFFAITKFLDIRCVNAVRLCAISINTAYIAHHFNIFRLFIKPYFQQYFSYIVAARFLLEDIGVSSENHRHVASHQQTLSHNAVSSTPRVSGIWTHNVSGNRHWLENHYCTAHKPYNIINGMLIIRKFSYHVRSKIRLINNQFLLSILLFSLKFIYNLTSIFWT
jgi:hypothetical protein